MDDQAPPPYAPSDPHTAMPSITSSASISAESPIQPSLRGGYIRRNNITREPSFTSTAAYFEERRSTIQRPNFVLRHSLNLFPGITRDDLPFPQPEDHYRARDVSEVDWYTFTNYLLLIAYEEINKATQSAAEESAEQERYTRVVAQWDEGFFGDRGIWLQYEPASLTSASRAVRTPSIPHSAAPSYSHPQHEHASHDDHHGGRWRTHRKHPPRSRSSSTSSSSSSSSSSSEESIASIASRDLDGLNNAQVQQSLNSFRQNAKVNLVAAVAQLRSELRSQSRVPGNGYNSREAKLQRRGLHRKIKGEIKAWQHSMRDAKRARKREMKAAKRERKQARTQTKRETKALWREEKQKYKTEKREAKQERKREKRARKTERKSGDRFERAPNPPMAFQGQQTGVLPGEGSRMGAPRVADERVGYGY